MSYTLTLTQVEASRIIEVLRQVPLDVLNAYGLTELVAKVTIELDEQVDDEVPYINSMGRVPTVGKVIPSDIYPDILVAPDPNAVSEIMSKMDPNTLSLSSESGSISFVTDSGSSSDSSSSSSSSSSDSSSSSSSSDSSSSY